jgi:hypothetical protein
MNDDDGRRMIVYQLEQRASSTELLVHPYIQFTEEADTAQRTARVEVFEGNPGAPVAPKPVTSDNGVGGSTSQTTTTTTTAVNTTVIHNNSTTTSTDQQTTASMSETNAMNIATDG